jgi:CBS domain-containing protein
MNNIAVKYCMTRPVTIIDADASLEDALDLMLDTGRERLPVVHRDRLVGMITRGDLLAARPSAGTTLSRAEVLTRMDEIPVSDVMSRNIISVSAETTAASAVALMTIHRISGLPVVEDGELVGIVTETDFFRALARSKPNDPIADAPASDWMSKQPITVPLNASAHDALELMRSKRVRRLPVMDGARVAGIVTMGDLRRSMGSELPMLARFELSDKLRTLPVRQIMSAPVTSIEPDTRLRDCARRMASMHIGGLPVTEGGGLVGMLTEHDILRAIAQSIQESTKV